MNELPSDENYDYPAFEVDVDGKKFAVLIFPRLYSPERGYVIPPVVQERIDIITKNDGLTSDDVILVALNRTLNPGKWQRIFDVAREQSKSVIAMATDCAERSERAVKQLRNEMSGRCVPLVTDRKKKI